MLRRIFFTFVVGAGTLAIASCSSPYDSIGTDEAAPEVAPAPESADIGGPLYASQPVPSAEQTAPAAARWSVDPITVTDCHLNAWDKEEVPAQRDGAIMFIGTDIKPEEVVPADLLVRVKLGGQERAYRRLKEGDYVEKDQLMAILDDRLQRDESGVKEGKVRVAFADLQAADKTRDETHSRYLTQLRLLEKRATSEEEVRAAKLLWDTKAMEAVSKRESVELAKLEANEAKTLLSMYEIRATVSGYVKSISKTPGEAVKALETVFSLRNLDKMRAEGVIDKQYFSLLKKGMKAVIEPTRAEAPLQRMEGHLQAITGIAVSKDRESPLIVSSSEDGTVRVWERGTRHERQILAHPAHTSVLCVACTSPAAAANLCLSGAADGVGRLWDLDANQETPLRELKDGHRGPINCVAFSPDGKWCATGGEDHQIIVWETASGALKYRFPIGHRASITSLQFTPQTQIISAGKDNALRIWNLGEAGAKLAKSIDRRSGDVAHLSADPSGTRVLFDQGKTLWMLSIPKGLNEGVLQNSAGAPNFSTFALFSPDGRLVLTGGSEEGRLQLWRTPDRAKNRFGNEVRQLAFRERPTAATCAAFAPNGKFIVTGGSNKQIHVWPVPTDKEIEQEIPATISLVEPAIESAAGQIRIWAEFMNPEGGNRLLYGSTVTMSIAPQ